MHRLRSIDALRGLAALAVIVAHTVEARLRQETGLGGAEAWILSAMTQYLDLGKIAVTVFFAISGFVIPYSLFRPSARPVASFAVARFFRLYPAYWLSIPFGLLFLFVLPGESVSPWLVPVNLLMIQQFVGVTNIIGLYWTLQIELIFYGLCVALFWFGLLDRRHTAAACALVTLAAAIGLAYLRFALERKFPVALPLALSVMFWGLCVRNRFIGQNPGSGRNLALVTTALVAAIPVVSLLAYNQDLGFQETWYRYTIAYWLALALFFGLTRYVPITNRPFVYLGTVSYSVYLFSPVAQAFVERAFGATLAPLPILAFTLVTALVTVAAASLVYHTVEAPMIACGRRIARRLDRAPGAVGLPEPEAQSR